MARLPKPGGDAGAWGDVLNDFLNQEHNPDGSLKRGPAIDQAQTAIANLQTEKADQAAVDALTPQQPGEQVVGGPNGAVRVPREFNVKAFGAVGNGVTDDTAAIQAAITAAGDGGTVVFPMPSVSYLISSPLVPLSYQTWIGPGLATASQKFHIQAAPALADAMVKATTTVNQLTMHGLSFRGPSSVAAPVAGSKGIYATDAQNWTLRDLSLHGFGEQAVHLAGGGAGMFERWFVSGALTVRSGYTGYIGAVDIGTSDARMSDIAATISATGPGDGWLAGIVVRGANGHMRACRGQVSEVGIVLASTATRWVLLGNIADLNQRDGYIVQSGGHRLLGNLALQNGQSADNTYDGFVTRMNQNTFIGNEVFNLGSDANRHRHGFTDTTASGLLPAIANRYTMNIAENQRGNLYNFSGSTPKFIGDDHAHTIAADNGNLGKTLVVGTSELTQIWATPLTVDRPVTLSTTSAYPGATFRIVRTATATGAVNLNVGAGPLKSLGAGQWCDVAYDGSAWMLTAAGNL